MFHQVLGLVHGIGPNVTVFEFQQPSDITYRYFDYNCQDNNGNYRELHLDKTIKSQKNLDFHLKPVYKNSSTYQTENGIQEFHNKPITLKQENFVVHFNKGVCYKASKNENIDFKHFSLVYNYNFSSL